MLRQRFSFVEGADMTGGQHLVHVMSAPSTKENLCLNMSFILLYHQDFCVMVLLKLGIGCNVKIALCLFST